MWRATPKVVFSSTIDKVDWNTRLVKGDAVAEISRLKADDGEPMRAGGATLAAAAMRAGLVDEYEIVTHPVLVGGGTPYFTALDSWVNLNLVETRTFPGGVVLTRYETRRGVTDYRWVLNNVKLGSAHARVDRRRFSDIGTPGSRPGRSP